MSERRRDFIAAEDGTLSEVLAREALEPSLVAAGAIFVAGKRCRELSFAVKAGARIVAHLAEPRAEQTLRILYEDRDLVVIDKAPGQHVNETETSAEVALVERIPGAYTVHRIDRETSGVVLLAKNKETADLCSAEFRERRVKKIYLAIVRGEVANQVIDAPIGNDKRRPRSRAITPDGKPARTRVRSLATAGEASAIEAQLLTGRTHQIRVHLAHVGAPIAGDLMYGGVSALRVGGQVVTADRVMLHALALTIETAGQERTFRAPVPADMLRFHSAGLSLASVIA